MGLVQYDSSDEDDKSQGGLDESEAQAQSPKPPSPKMNPQTAQVTQAPPRPAPTLATGPSRPAETQPPSGPELGPVMGPALGPARPPPDAATASAGALADDDVDMSFLDDISDPSAAGAGPGAAQEPPRSPYSARRALIRDLTLPAVANMVIPPSPPGSPSSSGESSSAAALTARFDEFLRLKRTRGKHFNEQLATSSAMRNPALMDKLLEFAGVPTTAESASESATAQYATTLPPALWDPAAFPAWAYRSPLRKAQERGTKDRERPRGEPLDFVAAGAPSWRGTPGGGPAAEGVSFPAATGKRKTRFDV